MKEVLEQLLILQDRDRRIRQLEREIQDIPARKKEIEDLLSGTKARIEALKEEENAHTAKTREIENEIESIREKIKKMRQQQFAIKSNEQYKALEHEIADAEKAIGAQEEIELECMESMDQLREREKELNAELAEEEKTVVAETKALDERLKNIESDLAGLKQERNELASNVPDDSLSQYDRIMQHWSDYAIVAYEDDGTCGGCHMKLPPQLKHDVMRGERLVNCSYCGRFLHV